MSENINIRNFLIKIFEQKANEALVCRLGFNPTSNRKNQK